MAPEPSRALAEAFIFLPHLKHDRASRAGVDLGVGFQKAAGLEHIVKTWPEFLSRLAHFAVLGRSEEHTSEPQSLMRISYAYFCLNKKKHINSSSKITIPQNSHKCTTQNQTTKR